MSGDRAHDDERQIRQLEDESHEALLHGDTEALGRILADDFVFTDPEGNVVSKAAWIAEMKSGEISYETIHLDDCESGCTARPPSPAGA